MVIRPLLTLSLIAVSACGVFGQTCTELKILIDKTYGFKPSRLTPEQRGAKSSEMDRVWNAVDSNVAVLLPCLRSEVGQRRGDSFFRFNASNLIFKHDRSVETKRLMIETYAEADLADINLQYWLPFIAEFGRQGLDVTKAGQTWMRFPKPFYYLPQHGTRAVDRGIGALGIFGSMDESVATPAIALLAGDENNEIRSIALWLLLNQATAESDKAIATLGSKLPPPIFERLLKEVSSPKLIELREGKPKTSRDEFVTALNELIDEKPERWLRLTADVPDGERDMVAVMGESDLVLLRKVRRYYAAKATPHSPEWYESFTRIINTIRAQAKAKVPAKQE